MRGALFNRDSQQDGFQQLPLAGSTEGRDPRGWQFAALWNVEKTSALPYASTPVAME